VLNNAAQRRFLRSVPFDPPFRVCYVGFDGKILNSEGGGTIPVLDLLLLASPLGKLLAQTGWVARIVLLILLGFSIFSWALILQKLMMFSRLERQTTKFLHYLRTTKGLPEPTAARVAAEGSPLLSIYTAGYQEWHSQMNATNPHGGKVWSLRAITARMQSASGDQVRAMERYLPWLATTASVTPFIGLFGTVWGVMDAFSGLGEGSASTIRAVAPGMAEALIATAAGLFCAIPAVIAYNHFVHHVRELASRMDAFTVEFVSQIEKQFG
jgi:biopolymer transport protein TolQ